MVELFCVVVGVKGSAFSVKIERNKSVDSLKELIKDKKRKRTINEEDEIQLFLAKQDGNWLETDSDVVKRLKQGEMTREIEELTQQELKLQEEASVGKVLESMPHPSTDHIHLLVDAPAWRHSVTDWGAASGMRSKRAKLIHNRTKHTAVNRLGECNSNRFLFSDRAASFEVLGRCVSDRFTAWQAQNHEKKSHPILFVAGGAGSGKSRFLHELPRLFKAHVMENSHFDECFKRTLSKATFLNLSFGHETPLRLHHELFVEGTFCELESCLCRRILWDGSDFGEFCEQWKHETFSLAALLRSMTSRESQCIVVGIDDIGNHHKAVLFGLITLLGSLSCAKEFFFVPIIAGTAIGALNRAVAESAHLPCHIPLPFLSFESCVKILRQKKPLLDVNSSYLKQVVSDVGRHCRALEFLYDSLTRFNARTPEDWIKCSAPVRTRITESYCVESLALRKAIAYAFLSIPVGKCDIAHGDSTFLDLEESGMVKLQKDKDLFHIEVPFAFVWGHLRQSPNDEYCKLWSHLLIGNTEEIGWLEWEVFNRNFLAFRLSLYAFLGYRYVGLTEFFAGAGLNLHTDIKIKIPPIDRIQTREIAEWDPGSMATRSIQRDVGLCVLVGSGASFDAFVRLQKSDGRFFLIAEQMKTSRFAVTSPVDPEQIKKCFGRVDASLRCCEALLIVLCRRDEAFVQNGVPTMTAVVCNSQLTAFYGDAFCQRLKKEDMSA